MEQFGIVYLLPETAKTYHKQLRLDIENEFGLTGSTQFTSPSHITMKYPFEAEHIEEVEDILYSFSNSQAQTIWSLKGFGHFINPDFRVIFIDVKPSQATRAAHARFLQKLRQRSWMQWSLFDGTNLNFHVTLANRGLTLNNFESVWNYVNQREQPQFELFFDNFALLKIESEIHTVYKRYQFQE